MDLRADREQLFGNLAHPDTMSAFFERVADDVDWTVAGTHPIAGRYTDKQVFLEATFDRLRPLMREGIHLELRHLFVDGDTAVVELQAMSTTLDGSPYDYILCWVCRFDSAEPGATVVEVRAYLDSAMVTWTITRNEQLLLRGDTA
jgi:ketosteroid isomerase-like protein